MRLDDMNRNQLRPIGCAFAVAALVSLGTREAISHPDLTGTIAAAGRRLESQASAENYLERAELHRIAGRYPAAARDLEQAAALDPRLPAVALCRAALALDRGRTEEARRALAEYRIERPRDPRGWLLDARLSKQEGRWNDAARALDWAARLQPAPSPDLFIEQARLLQAAGEPPSAGLAALERGIGRLGPVASLEIAAADLEAAGGRREAALARVERLGARLESPWAVFPQRAALMRQSGDADAARWLEAATIAARRSRNDWMEPAVTGPGAPRAITTAAARASVIYPFTHWLAARRGARPARATAAVTRGPYLQRGSPSRVTVRWRTDVATDSRASYGASPGALTSTRDDLTLTTEHEITLQGLSPATRYYYSIGTTAGPLAGGDASHSFVTSPAAGTPVPTRLWVIGDSGTGNSTAMAVRDAFAAYAARPGSRAADLWLMLGDNAYSIGTDAEYQGAVFDMYPAMLRSTVLWPTRGNHDGIHAGANNDYYDIFSLPIAGDSGGLASGTEAYYSFDHANIHFVCLDSEGSDRSVGGAMATWLRTDLAATRRDWVIAFWHHPPYTKGSHDSDNENDSGARMGEMRRNILPILDSAGVDLALTGHSHSYERSFLIDGHYGTSTTLTSAMVLDPGDGRWNGDGAYSKPTFGTELHEGTVHTVAGASGHTGGGALNHPVMVASLDVAGSLVIDVAASRLDARYLDTQGAIRDSFTIVKGTPGVNVDSTRNGSTLELIGRHPASGPMRFAYQLATGARARLLVLDSAGRPVRTLRSGPHPAGRHEAVWDGLDARGRSCPAGVYFAVLDVGGRTTARKVVFLGR